MIWRCDLQAQYEAFREEVLSTVSDVLESGRYTLAERVRSFEAEFAEFVDAQHCLSVGSGTDALIISLKLAGIEPGDEVITTPFTAIPTVSAIIAAGAKPVFVDIEESTYLMDINKALAAVNERTKAVMPVHIFGNVFDVEALRSELREDILMIEDAAQAHGSRIRGRSAGAIGDLGAFSFYPTKNLGGYGDGGAIVFEREEFRPRIERLRQYGMVDKDHIVHHGINSRMDEIQAAILLVKLKHLEAMNRRRRELADVYVSELEGYLLFQEIPKDVVHNFHVMVGRVIGDRNALLERMTRREIQCNIYYPLPLHLQEANRFLGYQVGDFPITEKLCGEVLALPMYPELPEPLLRRTIEVLRSEMGEMNARFG